MSNPLTNLNKNDREDLYLIPVWVSILVAGADESISKKEVNDAIRLANRKQHSDEGFIREFYKKVADKFEVNIKGYLALMPKDVEDRNSFLVDKIKKVNKIFPKLDSEVAHKLYLSFRDFANCVAQASGGLFGLLSISYAESKYLDLKMIDDPMRSDN